MTGVGSRRARPAADRLPALTGDPELLAHLALRRRERIFAAAHAPAREHPATISVGVAHEDDGIAATETPANAARARPASEPPRTQHPQREPVARRPSPPRYRHASIVSGSRRAGRRRPRP